VGLGAERGDHGVHTYIRYENVRVPKENLLGERGGAFVVAQTRLGGGRIHHAMRTIGHVQKALAQEKIADTWMDLQQFRLFVLQTAWKIDRTATTSSCGRTSPRSRR